MYLAKLMNTSGGRKPTISISTEASTVRMGGLVNTSFKKPLIPRLWEAVPDRSTSIRITDWVKMVLAR